MEQENENKYIAKFANLTGDSNNILMGGSDGLFRIAQSNNKDYIKEMSLSPERPKTYGNSCSFSVEASNLFVACLIRDHTLIQDQASSNFQNPA